MATFGNDINGDTFALQFVPSFRVFPDYFDPVLGRDTSEDVQILA
jgi:hypothetical protein